MYMVLRSMGVLQLFGLYRIRKDIRFISFVGIFLKEKKTSVKSSIFTTVNVNVLFDSI